MEHFYDGQIRRYVTQFMRIFIGFKWQDGDGNQQQVPVLYGDMNRQVANIIKENSENKMVTVPKVACYITGLELDKSRLSDSSFVSKVNIRERRWEENSQGARTYQNVQGGNYTVERLMPTPFKLTMKADIWTSNTDQKLQLMEQITVLFNPSLEIQTTDNYLDWTSLSVVNLDSIQFSTRNVPQGVDTEIDVASMTFEMPIWISPPSKVKKLGVVQSIISNVFTESGEVANLEDLVFNRTKGSWGTNTNNFSLLLFKSNNDKDYDYDVTVVNPGQAVLSLGLDQRSVKLGEPIDWNEILEVWGGYKPGSKLYFSQPNGFELVGTFVVNPLDPSVLLVTFDKETIPRNTKIDSDGNIWGYDNEGNIYQDPNFDKDNVKDTAREFVDSIVNPQRYNPITTFSGLENIPLNYRLLILEDIGGGKEETFTATRSSNIIDTGVEYGKVIPSIGSKKFKVYINGQLVNSVEIPTSNPKDNLRIKLTSGSEDFFYKTGDIVKYKIYLNQDGADAWAEYIDITDPSGDPADKDSELVVRANSIIEWTGKKWRVVFDPARDYPITVIVQNLKTLIKYKWDGDQWLKAFEGEYRSGSWGLVVAS
jgi:hypothetical protein